MNFPDRAYIRKRAALTQAELAHSIGKSPAAVCLWERRLLVFSAATVSRIAQILCERLDQVPRFENAEELAQKLVPEPQSMGHSAERCPE